MAVVSRSLSGVTIRTTATTQAMKSKFVVSSIFDENATQSFIPVPSVALLPKSA